MRVWFARGRHVLALHGVHRGGGVKKAWFCVAATLLAASAARADDISDCARASGDNAIRPCTAVVQSGGAGAAMAHEKLGDISFAANRFLDAANNYDDAVVESPNSVELLVKACRAYAVGNFRLDAGMADCQRALQRDGFNAGAHNVRGLIYFRQGKFAEALKDYDMSLHARPDHAGTLYMRGLTELKLGNAVAGNGDIDAAKRIDFRIDMELSVYGIRR
jgi:tetratricopeptide (TPR) repeat protein